MKLFQKFEPGLPDVSNKVFVITGTTSGTGYVAAQTVAEHGGEVVLLNRPSKRVDDSLEKLQSTVPTGKFTCIECDLQDFESVNKACDEIKLKYDKIYCLSNNAGIMATPDEATKDGYDTQMQTNHLSHFLLTAKLFPLLRNGAKEYGDARVVQHSSMARYMTKNDGLEETYFGANGGNLGGDAGGAMEGPKMHRYAQTKLANAVFSNALDDKIKHQHDEEIGKIRAIAAHPGISRTNLFDCMDFGRIQSFVMLPILSFFVMQSKEDGTIGLLKGMMDPSGESGALYGPTKCKGMAVVNPPKSCETDEKTKEMLWKMSEKATGFTFDI